MVYYTEMPLLRFLLFSFTAYAQERCFDLNGVEYRCVTINTGVRIPWVQAFSNVLGFASGSAVGICTLLFLVGAAQITISHGDQTKIDNGKKMMISALVGLAIILSAYAIVRTVLYFLYVGSA